MTDWRGLVVPGVRELEPLDVEATVALRGTADVVRLDWNENHFGPLPGVLEAVADELASASGYPVRAYGAFRNDVARHLGVEARQVVPGHGSQSLINSVAAAFLEPGDSVVVPRSTFYLYALASAARGATVHRVSMDGYGLDLRALADKAREVGAKLVWICDPNNPTGTALSRPGWEAFVAALPERCVAVADEAYADFLPPEGRVGRERDVVDGRAVIVLRTFSKFYGLAGLRLGYALADPAVASYLAVVDEPFNVSCASLAAGRASLAAAAEAVDGRRREVAEARELLAEKLRAAGAEPLPSELGFVLVRVDVDDAELTRRLAEEGVLVRAGSNVGLPGHVRVAVGPRPFMEHAATALAHALQALRG